METDASDFAVGAVLLQNFQDGEHPIYYASRTFSKAQRNWSVVEKECWAVVWSVSKFRHYLIGNKFTIRTDHKPLEYLLKKKDLHGKFARWIMKMQEFDFEIQYRKGSLNVVPDDLSRIATVNIKLESIIKTMQRNDKKLNSMIIQIESGQKVENRKMVDGLLVTNRNQILVPTKLIDFSCDV